MDTDSGSNGMMVGNLGMNFENFGAYPDPSSVFPDAIAIDFTDPAFYYSGSDLFKNDVQAQSYVSPSSLVSMSPSSIGYHQPPPATIGSPMAFPSILTPPTSSGSSTGTSSDAQYGGTSPSPVLNSAAPPKSQKQPPISKNAPTPSGGPKKRGRKPKPIGTPTEEAIKRNQFLERNRVAATKCRDKKKQKDSALQRRVQLLQSENVRSKNALNMLCDELEDLVIKARKHTEGNCCADELQATVQKAAVALEASQNSSLIAYTPPAFDDASPSLGMSPTSILDMSSVAGGFENTDEMVEDDMKLMDFSDLSMFDERTT